MEVFTFFACWKIWFWNLGVHKISILAVTADIRLSMPWFPKRTLGSKWPWRYIVAILFEDFAIAGLVPQAWISVLCF